MATQQEVIKRFMKYLDTTTNTGTTALNAAIKSATGSAFTSFKQVKAAMINDMKKAKSADDFLKTYCGIDYSNSDSGLLVGKETGVSESDVTGADSVPESGSLKNFKKNSFTKKGLTVKLGDGKTFKQLSATEKFIWQGLYTWWVEGALNLIEKSYGSNFSFGKKSSATVKEMSVTFKYNDDKNSPTDATTFYGYYDNGDTGRLELTIWTNRWTSLENDLSKANTEFDRVIAHELTHAVMLANMNCYLFESLPGFVKEGLGELTGGVKDRWEDYIKELAASPSTFEKNLSVSKTASNVLSQESGFIFFRYLARQAGDLSIENNTDNTTVQTFYGNDKITNYASKSKIISGAGNDTVENFHWNKEKITIVSGEGNDVIKNICAYSTLDGGEGNDSIHNWNNNVKIFGGAGNDSLVNDKWYDKANKVTIDGGEGNDFIWNDGNNVSIVGGAGNDTVWNYGSKVTIYGGSGNDYLAGGDAADKMYGGTGNDSVWGNAGNDVLYGDAGNDKLFGGDGKDKLYGGSGNDSLWGGAGNDTLWGDAGNDTFIYTANEGTDRIMDYESNDMLTILNADGSNGSFKGSKYSGGDLTLTITGGGKVIFDDVSKSDTFNINGTTYKISGSKLKK